MKFKTHNDSDFQFEGGSLQGCITETYGNLKKVFGKPHDSDGYKTDAEWEIKFEDGTYVSIYNYKNGKNYNGKHGIGKTRITNWHIGGSGGKHGVNLVKQAIAKALKPKDN